jgi:protein-L-isoaspartate(D-aspartate) O-methyltransferase
MLVSMSRGASSSRREQEARSQQELVEQLHDNGAITSDAVAEAMIAVDRKHYAHTGAVMMQAEGEEPSGPSPYANAAAPIGQLATISAPHAHAQTLQQLEPFLIRADAPAGGPLHVLDVGSGSGYLTACIAHMLSANGSSGSSSSKPSVVVALEHSSVLLEQSQTNMTRDAHTRRIVDGKDPAVQLRFLHASALDASLSWWPASEPRFDVIHVGAAFAALPEHLLSLLRVGGRMLVPVASNGLPAAVTAANNGAVPVVATASAVASPSMVAPSTSVQQGQAGPAQQLLLVELLEREDNTAEGGKLRYKTTIVHSCSLAPIKQTSVKRAYMRALHEHTAMSPFNVWRASCSLCPSLYFCVLSPVHCVFALFRVPVLPPPTWTV